MYTKIDPTFRPRYAKEFTLYQAGIGRNPHQYELVLKDWDWESHPMSILVTYAYPQDIDMMFGGPKFHKKATRVMLDSGAFSAMNAGIEIDLDDYMEFILHGKWRGSFHEVVALDVISQDDGKMSWDNANEMVRNGIDCLPVFHYGDDFKYLAKYCKRFEKVGISVSSSLKVKSRMAFLKRVFTEAYPHKFHMFGWASQSMLSACPFHSADSTSYVANGFRYGSWSFMHGMKGVCRVRKADAFKMSHMEILKGLEVEKFIRARWSIEIKRQVEAWRNRK